MGAEYNVELDQLLYLKDVYGGSDSSERASPLALKIFSSQITIVV